MCKGAKALLDGMESTQVLNDHGLWEHARQVTTSEAD